MLTRAESNAMDIENPFVGRQSNGLIKLLFYIIPLIMGLIYWLAFFPGVMSFDSVNQWDQIATFKITNLHPAFHTILEWLLTRIWYSPAMISLFQIVLASLVIGYGLSSIQKSSRLPGTILVALVFLISANPLVGVMDVTLWKDVIYSFAILLLTIFLFMIIRSDGVWIVKPLHFSLLGSTLAIIWLTRFNGWPVVVVSLITMGLLYKKNIKQIAFSTLIGVALIIFVQVPIFSWFKVNRAVKYTYGITLIHPVVAYVNSKTDLVILTDYEKQYLNKIYPLKNNWPYSCYDATVFYYEGTTLNPVINDPFTLAKIFTRLAIHDPKIMLNHYSCLSSFVWQPNQPQNVYLETILFDNYDLDQRPSWQKYTYDVSQKSILPQVRGWIERIAKAEWNRDVFKLMWRPAIYMYLFLASLAFFVFRTGRRKWWLLSAPLAAQSIVMMFTAPLQALRYQYPVYLIAMLFTLPLLLMGWKKMKLDPVEKDIS
ncbi:MAG: hypothetical protein A2Y88_06320 [Chloroflexi bacterium RBG_13_48_10]|nr:MAG: hypothetical protein A2Y88_06320 [Chloroflexi bacterium RBG_13_48_10]